MIKKVLTTFFIFFTMLSVNAFESCVITSDEKLTDIQIENPSLLQISPLVTMFNEKNTLIINPLKEGETQVCMLKNDKDIIKFNVKITEKETVIDETRGIEIFSLDEPEEIIEIDKPPSGTGDINTSNQ